MEQKWNDTKLVYFLMLLGDGGATIYIILLEPLLDKTYFPLLRFYVFFYVRMIR